VDAFIDLIRAESDEYYDQQASRPPVSSEAVVLWPKSNQANLFEGKHGITRDSLRFYLGRSGQTVDLQENL